MERKAVKRKWPTVGPVGHSLRLFPACLPWPGALAGLALLLVTVSPGAAQQRVRWQLGGALVAGLVVESSSEYLNGGIGPELDVLYSVHPNGVLSLRSDVTYLPLADDNALLVTMLGVQGEIPLGTVRPYASAELGLTTGFPKTGGLGGSSSATSWSLGAGFRFELSDRPAYLDLGGRIVHSGPLDFSASDQGVLDPTNMLMLRAGFSVGIR